MAEKSLSQRLDEVIPTIHNFPREGIAFKDITPVLLDPKLMNEITDALAEQLKGKEINGIVGLESRGFIFGVPLALKLGISFIMARKPFKLPGEKVTYTYEKEYGTDTLEMSKSAIKEGDKVVIVDDLLATGGTALAAVKLIGGKVVSAAFVIETTVPGFTPREKFAELGVSCHSLLVI